MVTFEEDEEELIDLIISVVDTGRHKFTYQEEVLDMDDRLVREMISHGKHKNL